MIFFPSGYRKARNNIFSISVYYLTDTTTKYHKETYGNVFLKNVEPNYRLPFIKYSNRW